MIRKRRRLDDGQVEPTERDKQLRMLDELAEHFKECEDEHRKPFTFGGYDE